MYVIYCRNCRDCSSGWPTWLCALDLDMLDTPLQVPTHHHLILRIILHCSSCCPAAHQCPMCWLSLPAGPSQARAGQSRSTAQPSGHHTSRCLQERNQPRPAQSPDMSWMVCRAWPMHTLLSWEVSKSLPKAADLACKYCFNSLLAAALSKGRTAAAAAAATST